MKAKYLPILLCLYLLGCPSHNAPDPINATGNSIAQNQAYTTAAKNDVVAAKPHADEVGKSRLDSATTNLDSALTKSSEAQTELAKEQKDKADLYKQYIDEHNEKVALQNSWGHKVQVWVTRSIVLIVALIAAHFALGIAALFVKGPVGAVMAWVGAAINPFAWVQMLRDNYYFRKQASVAK